MGVVAYIDYTNAANDADIALIEADAGAVDVTYRIPALFTVSNADPLETIVYALNADAAIIAACLAVGVTTDSIDALV